jgi:hypothetical protein
MAMNIGQRGFAWSCPKGIARSVVLHPPPPHPCVTPMGTSLGARAMRTTCFVPPARGAPFTVAPAAHGALCARRPPLCLRRPPLLPPRGGRRPCAPIAAAEPGAAGVDPTPSGDYEPTRPRPPNALRPVAVPHISDYAEEVVPLDSPVKRLAHHFVDDELIVAQTIVMPGMPLGDEGYLRSGPRRKIYQRSNARAAIVTCGGVRLILSLSLSLASLASLSLSLFEQDRRPTY